MDPLEMYRVFNMGMGMVLFLAPEDADPAIRALQDAFPEGPARRDRRGDGLGWDRGAGQAVGAGRFRPRSGLLFVTLHSFFA